MRKHAQARGPLRAWLAEAKAARWLRWSDLRARYPGADLVGPSSSGHRVVFDIKDRSYRLVVLVYFSRGVVVIERVGTHAEYDKWKF